MMLYRVKRPLTFEGKDYAKGDVIESLSFPAGFNRKDMQAIGEAPPRQAEEPAGKKPKSTYKTRVMRAETGSEGADRADRKPQAPRDETSQE